MTAFKTTGPDAEPVTLAQAKAHLRVTHDSEDELIADLVRAARADVEATTGTALMVQGWRKVFDAAPSDFAVGLAPHPVREISAVTGYGPDGEAFVVPPARYQTDLVSRPARLVFDGPLADLRPDNGIEIDFVAGFGETATEVPDLLKRAVLLLVGHWYEFRAAFDAQAQPVSHPSGYDRLIAPFRRRSLR